jgi:hypothetical protein
MTRIYNAPLLEVLPSLAHSDLIVSVKTRPDSSTMKSHEPKKPQVNLTSPQSPPPSTPR